MMKFNWRVDLHPTSDKELLDKLDSTGPIDQHGAWRIPTVDEVDDTLSFMYADTVLQILRGQGIYYGYEVKRDVDNEIRVLSKEARAVYIGEHKPQTRHRQAEALAKRKAREEIKRWRETEKMMMRTIKKVARFRKVSLIEAEIIVRTALVE